SFPCRSEMATAQPEGKATSVPTQVTRSKPRSLILSVGQAQSFHCSVKLRAISPKTYPLCHHLTHWLDQSVGCDSFAVELTKGNRNRKANEDVFKAYSH